MSSELLTRSIDPSVKEARKMREPGIQIMIVDDNSELCEILAHCLETEGFNTQVVHDGEDALGMMRSQVPDVMLLDIKMPGMDGLEVLRRAKEIDPDLPVVMITASAEIQGAVEAIKSGAHDYLAKPFDNYEVLRVVYRSLVERDLKRKLRRLSAQVQERWPLKEVMGSSEIISRLESEVKGVAKLDSTVVILGETGSGKELVAQAIHNLSHRSKESFVRVDCGAVSEMLLESELFGHEKGAFTEAVVQRSGKFELAKGGTLFLDEISNMPLGSQAKLLQVLQDKVIYRVGGTQPIQVDVRLLVTNNQNLQGIAESGSFRRDLFYHLNEFNIVIPPLRERKEDILYLSKRFLDTANMELNKAVKGFSESAIESLINYNWPGNVRQLRAAILRGVLLADDVVTEKHLDLEKVSSPGLTFNQKIQEMFWGNHPLKEFLRHNVIAIEREVLIQALKHTGGNKAKAARLLQIDYKTIHTKVKQLGISVKESLS
jgi:two-component system nitrogen regulation response regulator GlnG